LNNLHAEKNLPQNPSYPYYSDTLSFSQTILTKWCIDNKTTLNFEKIIEYLESLNLELDIKNTICSATRVRQQSARELSSKVDVMVVIGGKHSSNTQKLVNICKERGNTVSIETREDLYDVNFSNYETIGVTAGASTPDWIIHEAIEYLEKL